MRPMQKIELQGPKGGKFSIEDEPLSGRQISMSLSENIDAVHDKILSDSRIGLKRI